MTNPDTFWSERPILTHIYQYAQARRVSPWATFGGVLTRVIAATEPRIQLPAIVGGPGSLNLFVGIVGRSGQGKGASQAAAASCITISGGAIFDTITVGSGEGLAASYVQRVKDDDGNLTVEQHSESALFDVAEVDTLSALAGRQGSTLLSELRKVWSGERLGFQNRDQARSLPVESHTYRAALVVGVQPTRSGALLDDADGGTPQRFIWLPATDDHAPDRAPLAPPPLMWHAPGESIIPTIDGRRTITVCDSAWNIIDRARVARLRGDGDALDGHALFSRLKLAAALAILDGRGDVTDDDWRMGGAVMDVSDRTRAWCREAIRQQSIDTNRARAEARAESNVTAADHAEIVAINRAKDRIVSKLGTDWVGGASLRKSLTQSLRAHFEAALDELAEEQVIEISRDQSGTRARLTGSRVANSSPPLITPDNPRDSAARKGDTQGVASPSPRHTLVTPEEVPA
ncbi:hypothetical protein ACFVSU_02670 [Microbacterium sp. NPDC058062]|uniref:hypothetical protein n=1 Tax=Microbacterium sp. NPDC058062 TaxID=3346320 RepID=UPI0036D9C6F2